MKKKLSISTILAILLIIPCLVSGNINSAHAKDSVVTIEFVQWWRPEMGEKEFDAFIERFHNEYPNIRVKVTSLPYNQMHQQIIATHAVGKVPDVVGMDMAWTTEFIELGILEPLDTYLEKEKGLYEQLLKTPMEKVQGHTWMLPVANCPFFLFYNKDLFRQEGLNKPPSSWDELKEYAIKLTKPEKNQYGLAMFLSLQTTTSPTNTIFPILYSAGGRVVKDGKPTIDTPEMIESLTFFKELYDLGVIAPGLLTKIEQQILEEFASGRIGMMAAPMPHIANIRSKSPDLDFGVALFPKKTTWAARAPGWEVGISKNSKNKEAAWKFISWLVSAEINAEFAAAGGLLPGNISVDPEFLYKDPHLREVYDDLKNADIVEELLAIPNASDNLRVFTIETQKMILGEQSVEETVKNIQKSWDEVFDKYYKNLN